LKEVFSSSKITKVGYDLKLSMHALDNLGVTLSEPYYDIQIAAYLLQEGSGGISFADLSFKYLGRNLQDKKDSQLEMIEEMSQESLADRVEIVSALYEIFEKKFKAVSKEGYKDLTDLFQNIEISLIDVLVQMEKSGILIDCDFLRVFSKKLEKEIRAVQKKAFKVVGHEFNLNSPSQVSEILFEELDLPKSRKTKGGKYSTGAGVLEGLRGVHPVVEEILKYRELSKLSSTYTLPLIESVNPDTKRIHTTFSQVVATTGRLSSSNPNLQNIPISTKLGKEVRKAFIAPKGSSLISFDYSQQELRILAHLAKGKNLIEAFKSDTDVHKLTASKLFDKDIAKIKKSERRIAKTINFAVMYGMGEMGLASSLGILRSEASEFIKKYFEEYSSVKSFFDRYLAEARDKGYAVTMFGRRRSASGLDSSNAAYRRATKREVINFPIQGSAADMMKMAMIEVAKVIEKKYRDKAAMILQIHDELVFEYKGTKGIETFEKDIIKVMSNSCPIDVPVKVESCEGENLYEIH
jgi:DNA polymerase-1